MSEAGEAARRRAAAALDLKRWDEAAREAAAAVSADPEDVSGHALLARAFLGKGDSAEAQRAADAGLARHPHSEWLFRLRSLALRQQKRYPEALAASEEAVKLLPDSALGHYTKALALAGMKRVPEARSANEKAVELDPDNAEIRSHLGDLFLDREPARAERHYRDALALEPNDACTLNNLGVALKKQGMAKEAAVAFKSAVLLDPTLAVAKRNAHSTVGELLRVGGVLGGGAIVALQAVRLLALAGKGGAGVLLAFGLFLGGGGYLVWRLAQRRRRKDDLASMDPQLLEIWKKLDADKKHGRL
jgi:tetratricopeptide (TPR) repeat protein